jgi:hypothetical protein
MSKLVQIASNHLTRVGMDKIPIIKEHISKMHAQVMGRDDEVRILNGLCIK